MTGQIPKRHGAALLALVAALPAQAQMPTDRVEMLERELAAQKDRIARLESLIERQNAALQQLNAARQAVAVPAAPAHLAPPSRPAPASFAKASPGEATFGIPGLDVGGDVRVREEFNISDADARSRSRSVLRARLRATYQITKHFRSAASSQRATPMIPIRPTSP